MGESGDITWSVYCVLSNVLDHGKTESVHPPRAE